LPLIKEIIAAYGLAIFEKEGYEADDVIATIARKAKEQGLAVTIISSDKDILQLVDEDVTVFSPYKDEGTLYDRDKVRERFGVEPQKISDIIALMGDDADNIPGVPGIGEKTAVNLMEEFGSLDDLLRHAEKIKQEKLKDAVLENIDRIKLNKELAVLDSDVGFDFQLSALKIGQPNRTELARLFRYLEFKKLLKGLDLKDEDSGGPDLERVEARELEEAAQESKELFLFCDIGQSLSAGAKNKFCQGLRASAGLKKILVSPAIKKISHDLKKVILLLSKQEIKIEGVEFDTMLAAYLLNPSRPRYNLEDVAWDYLGKPLPERPGPGQAIGALMELKPRLEKELKDKELYGLFSRLEMPLTEVLAQMELKGIKLDLKVLGALSGEVEKKLIKLIDDIYTLSGAQFNINSPKQLREILFEKLRLPVVKRSKTGPSTDEEVLRALALKHELPQRLLDYRQLMKLKTTYIDTLPLQVDPETGRLHTTFNQAGTETGRLSSSNPNLQNIPAKTDIGRNIRRSIVSSDKKSWLLSCDYSQVELRILAHLSGDAGLISAFQEDKDIHKATAALIYGCPEQDITDELRETAKRVNFGIIYGLTYYGLSRDLGITVDEAQNFIDAYFLRYPEVKEYINEQITKARKDGYVTTILGRRRYLPEINNKNQGIRQFAERQAVNTPIQGSASDLIKLAMLRIDAELKKKNLKSKMVLQVHDELVFDAPDEEAEEAAALVKSGMEDCFTLKVPVKAQIKKGRNWLEMESV
jgi:DNA polymerase-1